MSENYYILLELDPEVDDWPTIEAAIETHRRKWSLEKNQGGGANKRAAARNMALLPEIRASLADPEKRQAIANAAREELRDNRKMLLEKLDGLIELSPDPQVDTAFVKRLLEHVKGLTEADVLARLQQKGKTVVSAKQGAGGPRVAKPRLDPTLARDIRDQLDSIKKRSLYEFLDMGSTTSPEVLRSRADEIYKEITREGRTDPVSTIRQHLAGYCMVVFKDRAEKQRYDNTRAVEAMELLAGQLDLAGHDRFLETHELDTILKNARMLGVTAEDAQAYIEEFAEKRGWKIQRQARLPSQDLKLCGRCSTLARTAQDTRCRHCGLELELPCPSCGHPTPTQDECCSKCGFSTGDVPVIDAMVARAGELAKEGDFAAAIKEARQALGFWPSWKPARAALELAEDGLRRRNAALDALANLVRGRKLEEASTSIEQFRRTFGDEGTAAFLQKVKEGTDEAQKEYREGELHRSAGRTDAAVDAFFRALNHCADFSPALKALASTPPAAPTNLQVTPVGSSERLAWHAGGSSGRNVAYVIVRKAGGAPSGLADGQRIGEVTARTFDDVAVPPGTPWHYTVFAVRGGVASVGGASSGPHIRTAELDDLRVECGDRQVSLRFKRPQGCIAVEATRHLGTTPGPAGSGNSVPVVGDSLLDQGLSNDTDYCYLLVACFAAPDRPGVHLRSHGIQVRARPVTPPAAVKDLQAQRTDRDVFLRWTQPPRGEVQIRQTRQLQKDVSGLLVSLADAERFGTPLVNTGPGTAQVRLDGQGLVHFVPLSVIGQTAVVGTPVSVATLDDVSDLSARRQGNTIVLTWTWPAGAKGVRVVWKYSDTPRSPEGMKDGLADCTRAAYDAAGQWELRDAPHEKHFFTVFIHEPQQGIFSSGRSVVEATGLESVVAYRVKAQRRLFGGTAHAVWVELESTAVPKLPAVIAVMRSGHPPTRPTDGSVVGKAAFLLFAGGRARLDLNVSGQKGFVKLFFEDGEHAREIRLLPAARDSLEVR